MDRRTFLRGGVGLVGGVGVLGLSGLLAACGSSKSASASGADLTPAGLQFNYLENVQFGGSFMALSKGYYKAQGLDVSFLPGGPNISVEPIVSAGRALVGISHTANCIPALVNGAPLTVIGAGYQKNPNCIISKKSAPITHPSDLLGKKVAVDPSEQPLFSAFIKANGLDASKITVVTIGFDVSSLVSGEVDGQLGFVTNENIILQQHGIPTAVMLLGDHGYPLMEELYVARSADVADPSKRRQLASFMRAEAMGWRDAIAQPAAAAKLAVDVYGTSQKLSLAQQTAEAHAQIPLVESSDTQAHGLFWMTQARVEATLRSLALGGVKGKTSYFTNQVLTEAYQHGRIV